MQYQRIAIDVVGRLGPCFTRDAAWVERVAPRPGRPPASGTRSARKPSRGAAWLALTLCVAASAAHAQTVREVIDASDAAAVAVAAQGHPTCDPADGPCFDPFAQGSVFEGCRTPVLDQEACFASAPLATAAMVELAVCMANVRAGFPAPPIATVPIDGNPDIQASAQENMFCGPGGGCGFSSTFEDHMNWVLANGVTSGDCWNWDTTFTGSCPSTCPNSPSASFSDLYQVMNQRDFETAGEVRDYLENVGPVVGTMDIRDGFMAYMSGVYAFIDGAFVRDGHVILIYGFGYDPASGFDYWFAKNSFGEAWGEFGYFRIAIDPAINRHHLDHQGFRAAEGVACTTVCGGICGQFTHSVCKGRGTCQGDGTCTCDAGFGGSLCERTTVCGDGFVDAGEGCDDGSTVDADGCSATCTVESGFICTGEPSVCITAVPAVSKWGLIVITILVLTAGAIVVRRHRSATAEP